MFVRLPWVYLYSVSYTHLARASLEKVTSSALAKELGADVYTIEDILDAIRSPLRDYRERYDAPILRSDRCV